MPLNIGTIYEVRPDIPDYPEGLRLEFIGGPDDDVFTDGSLVEYFDEDEVRRSTNQTPLELTEVMQIAKSRAMSGYDPV